MSDAFNFVNAFKVEICLSANIFCGVKRNFSEFSHCIAGGKFHVQNRLPLIFYRPKLPHFGQSVAFNHEKISSQIQIIMRRQLYKLIGNE